MAHGDSRGTTTTAEIWQFINDKTRNKQVHERSESTPQFDHNDETLQCPLEYEFASGLELCPCVGPSKIEIEKQHNIEQTDPSKELEHKGVYVDE